MGLVKKSHRSNRNKRRDAQRHSANSADNETHQACLSIIDEMSASIPFIDHFTNQTTSGDIFSPNDWTRFKETELLFDTLSIPCDLTTTMTPGNADGGGGHLEFSPASMPSSCIDDELFGCSENSNDYSCSDLLTSSLDLTIYGQVAQSDWAKFAEFPAQLNFTNCDVVSGDQQAAAATAETPPSTTTTLESEQTELNEELIMIDGSVADDSQFFITNQWDDLSNQRVLSILEPGLDFEGLIDLDHL